MMIEQDEALSFDAIFLGHCEDFGGGHLEDAKAVSVARKEDDLILSQQAEKFCSLVVLNGYLPSEAYTQAFIREDENGVLVRPDNPASQARQLLRMPEVRERIEQIRDEVVQWGRTSFEECEMNLRRIALNEEVKDSDRIAATKALSAMRGFDAQPEGLLAGAVIQISMPWKVNDLSHRPSTLDGEADKVL